MIKILCQKYVIPCVDQLKEFKEDLENMKIEGNTRKKAVQRLVSTLKDKIKVIENKEE